MTPAAMTDLTVLALAVSGVCLIGIGALHVWLPQLMGWPAELKGLSPMTRLVVHVHSAFIGSVVAALGLAALLLGRELVSGEPLAVAADLFGALFFVARWLLELGPIGRRAEGVWRPLHYAGLVGWIAIAGSFAAAAVVGVAV